MNHQISVMDPLMVAAKVLSILHHSLPVCPIPPINPQGEILHLDVLGNNLNSKTLCPSAQQYLSSHYNLHNMYGYFEAKASNA